MKKLIPALVLLLISAMVLVTASYAWFSINSKVTVTGMEVKVKTSDNLLVRQGTEQLTLAGFATSVNSTADFQKTLNITEPVQSGAVLYPVSTVNGETFYYVKDLSSIDGKGDNTASSAIVAYDSNGVFQDDTDEANAVGYIDYTVELMATVPTVDRYISIKECELVYPEDYNGVTAFRVAVFVQKADGITTLDAMNAGAYSAAATAVGVVAPSGATYFSSSATEEAYKSTSALDKVDVIEGSDAVATITTEGTSFYRVTLRIYLEGEDTTCNNETFYELTKGWKLTVSFELKDVAESDGNLVIKSSGT